MPPFKTLLAASLLLISFMSGAASAGLYSSDTNNFFTLKTKLTDARQYRYAALVSAGDIGGDNFETLHRLARIYADILEKDMGVHVKLYETDALQLKNSNNFMTSAIEQIQRKNFAATGDTCAVASTFLYPSTVSNLLRSMAPDLLVVRNDPALYAKVVDLSKDLLAQELGVLMKMCDVSGSRKQTAAFKQFLEALHGEQSYIVSSARVSQGSERAIAASAAKDAEREEISKKALARNAERDKAYQDAEDARDAKIIADRAAELAEKKRMAQRQEDARQQALAARPPEQVQRDEQHNAPAPQRSNVAANEPYPGYSLLTEEDLQRCALASRWYAHTASMRDQGGSPDLIYQKLMALTKLPGYNHPPDDMKGMINFVILVYPGESPAMINDKMTNSCKKMVAKHRIENNPFDWTGMGV